MTARRRWITLAAMLVLLLGLASRWNAIPRPALFAEYAGDTLWAVLVFLLLAFVMPRRPALFLAGLALAIAFGVELLQLYHAPWLDALRNTLPGRLVLGQGFLYSDLVCYTIGIALAAITYFGLTMRKNRRAAERSIGVKSR